MMTWNLWFDRFAQRHPRAVLWFVLLLALTVIPLLLLTGKTPQILYEEF